LGIFFADFCITNPACFVVFCGFLRIFAPVFFLGRVEAFGEDGLSRRSLRGGGSTPLNYQPAL
jgi:hypothetical protein